MTGHPSSHPNQGAASAAPRRIVVVGGGPAAHRFTDAMHARGLEGWHITVLTEEAHLPYDRVALSRPSPTAGGPHPGQRRLWDNAAVP